MLITDSQLKDLIEIAKYVTLDKRLPTGYKSIVYKLISDIEGHLVAQYECESSDIYYICDCGSTSFHLNLGLELICTQCNHYHELSKILLMTKRMEH